MKCVSQASNSKEKSSNIVNKLLMRLTTTFFLTKLPTQLFFYDTKAWPMDNRSIHQLN